MHYVHIIFYQIIFTAEKQVFFSYIKEMDLILTKRTVAFQKLRKTVSLHNSEEY